MTSIQIAPRTGAPVGLLLAASLVLIGTTARPASASSPTRRDIARRLSLQVSYRYFADAKGAYQHQKKTPWVNLDWSTNGCHGGGDSSWIDTFTVVCQQHDFCLRNLGIVDKRPAQVSARCNTKWRTEARRVCRRFANPPGCRRTAADVFARLKDGSLVDF